MTGVVTSTGRRRVGQGAAVSRPGLDRLGLLLGIGCAGWTLVAGAMSGGDPLPIVAYLLAVGVCFVLGRTLASAGRSIPAAAVLLAGVAVAAAAGGDIASSEPLSGPFGYATARAAFFVQAGLAGLMLALAGQRAFLRIIGFLATAGSIAVILASGSSAAVALILALGGMAVFATVSGWLRAALGATAGLFVIVLATTIVLGATYAPAEPRTGRVDRLLDASLTERRLMLWSEALSMAVERPLTGVGPGRFQLASPTARADADARWAHHGFLQLGAETGVIGLVLLVGLFLWGFLELWAGPADALSVLAGAALAAIAIHASVDYILHFPAVGMAAAGLVGGATARRTLDRE